MSKLKHGRNVRPRIHPSNCRQCGKDFMGWKPKADWCSKSCYAKWLCKNRPTTKGRYVTTKGYVQIYRPDHPRATKEGYVMEHRLVMESMIGRLLEPTEVVRHRNGKKGDNRPENLELMEKRAHDAHRKPTYHATCPNCQHTFPARGNVRTVDHALSE